MKVWFSVGPKSVTVPDLSDYTQEDARNALEKLGFKVSSVTKTPTAPPSRRTRS